MLYPLIFQPVFKERVWGGRELQRLYAKPLPDNQVIGESWEIVDRPGDASVIANGPLAGKDLRWLMEHHAAELLGDARPAAGGRFPLLCKVLDAREKLSLQVHPPAQRAAELKGEPKTEMWYVTDAAPDASLYVGLKQGVTRAEFENRIVDGKVADCFHQIPVHAGDTMFLPSGRVHAIGSGLVIFEIQQNSDTTYRVFDWNRLGLDGQPRELHIPQSLASIDFKDFEPKLVASKYNQAPQFQYRHLVQDPLFNVQEMKVAGVQTINLAGEVLRIIAVVQGGVEVIDPASTISIHLQPGQFGLIPGTLKSVALKTNPDTIFLCVEAN